jgi:hypothetical protein
MKKRSRAAVNERETSAARVVQRAWRSKMRFGTSRRLVERLMRGMTPAFMESVKERVSKMSRCTASKLLPTDEDPTLRLAVRVLKRVWALRQRKTGFFECESQTEFINVWWNVQFSAEEHYTAIQPAVNELMAKVRTLMLDWIQNKQAPVSPAVVASVQRRVLSSSGQLLSSMGKLMHEVNESFYPIYLERKEAEVRKLHAKRRFLPLGLKREKAKLDADIEAVYKHMRRYNGFKEKVDALQKREALEDEFCMRFRSWGDASNVSIMHEKLLKPKFVMALTGWNPESLLGMPRAHRAYEEFKTSMWNALMPYCERGPSSPEVLNYITKMEETLNAVKFIKAWKDKHANGLHDVRGQLERAMAAEADTEAKHLAFQRIARATFDVIMQVARETHWHVADGQVQEGLFLEEVNVATTKAWSATDDYLSKIEASEPAATRAIKYAGACCQSVRILQNLAYACLMQERNQFMHSPAMTAIVDTFGVQQEKAAFADLQGKTCERTRAMLEVGLRKRDGLTMRGVVVRGIVEGLVLAPKELEAIPRFLLNDRLAETLRLDAERIERFYLEADRVHALFVTAWSMAHATGLSRDERREGLAELCKIPDEEELKREPPSEAVCELLRRRAKTWMTEAVLAAVTVENGVVAAWLPAPALVAKDPELCGALVARLESRQLVMLNKLVAMVRLNLLVHADVYKRLLTSKGQK